MAYFGEKNSYIINDHQDKLIASFGGKFSFKKDPDWFYSNHSGKYHYESFVIEDCIIFLKEAGTPTSKDIHALSTFLKHIITTMPPGPIYLVNDVSQHSGNEQALTKKIDTLYHSFGPFFSHICVILSKSTSLFSIPSTPKVSLQPSAQAAFIHCINEQATLLKFRQPNRNKELTSYSQKDLIKMIQELQEENQQLRMVNENRLTEILDMIGTVSEEEPEQVKTGTENLSASSLLQQEAAFWQLSLNYANHLVMLVDRQGIIRKAIPSVESILGYPSQLCVGMPYSRIVHGDDQKYLSLDMKEGTTHPIRMKHHKGNFLWMEVQAVDIKDNPYFPDHRLLIASNIHKNKELIERLLESREQLKSTLCSIDDDVYVFDKQQQLISFHGKHEKALLVETPLAHLGETFNSFLHQDISGQLDRILSDVVETQTTQQFEHSMQDASGLVLYFKISVNYRKNNQDQYAGFSMVVRETTEEKLADKKIIASEKKYRSVVESVREIIFQTNKSGQLTFANPAWKETSHYDIYESLEKPLYQFVYQDDRSKVKTLIEKVLTNQCDEVRREVRFVDKYSHIFWVEMFFKALLDDNGNLLGISGTLNDITKRKNAEETLKQSNQLMESINKNIKEALVRVKHREGFAYYNHAFKDMFGYACNEEIDQLSLNAMFADQDELQQYTKALIKEGNFTNQTILFKRKDGSTFWGLSSFILIKDENGQQFFDGAIRDITDHKEAEKKLQEKNQELSKTNQELDRFVYSASHDLRAPLASTLGLINISRITEEPKERTYYLELMEQSLNRMDKLIQDLTDYSRNSRLEIETEEINFDHMITDIFQRLKYLKDLDRVTVQKYFDIKSPYHSDKIRLYIVLINLLSNAIKYHKYDQIRPYIRIEINSDEKQTEIKVSDNGIGIDKNYQDKIFTMFFQVSRDAVGSGLGLYIVKETVNKLRGTIKVRSVINEGSVFTITIPNAKTYQYDQET